MTPAYTRFQKILHWVIFVLILAQYALHEPMAQTWDAIEKGDEPAMSFMVAQHAFVGILIFILVIIRLFVRASRGAPPLPENEPAALKVAAHATHLGLYGLMILMPLSGAIAWFGGVSGAADAHEVMRGIMLLLILIHIAGALFQAFILKSDVMHRMTRG